MKNKILLFVIAAIFLSGCKKEKPHDNEPVKSDKKVYYISNEGAFGYGNGSLSLFYPEDISIDNQAFKKVNGRKAGDVIQSVFISGNKLFLIANASNKVEIANAETIESIKTLENISLPRYMAAGSGNTAFLSCWGNNGKVLKINTSTLTTEDSAATGNGPEKMLVISGKLVVCNSGGFTDDSTLTIIDTSSVSVIKTINTAINPTDIVSCSDSTAWIICRGKIIYDQNWQPVGERKAALIKINITELKVTKTITLATGLHPSHIDISPDGKTLYFGGGYNSTGIYSYDIPSGTISTTPVISGNYYGFDIEPATGNIYCLEAISFTAAGRLKVFSPGGNKLFEVKTGIGPNGVIF